MVEAFKSLSDEQYKFIEDEFGINKDSIFNMTEEEMEELYYKLCDIESHEACIADNDGPLSDRGETAADIVTTFNVLVKSNIGFVIVNV